MKEKEHRVVIRKLGRERAHGLAWPDNKIEIDAKLSGYPYLLTLLHEHFHLKHPDWSETKIERESRKTAKFLWNNNFRYVELK